MRHRLWGLPFSTRVTLSLRSARRSTNTMVGSGQAAPCRKYMSYELLQFDPCHHVFTVHQGGFCLAWFLINLVTTSKYFSEASRLPYVNSVQLSTAARQQILVHTLHQLPLFITVILQTLARLQIGMVSLES